MKLPHRRTAVKARARHAVAGCLHAVQELFPISLTITGNIAVVQYHYMVARENYKKERERVTGHYTDVLVKEGGRWLFLSWAGGDDPKK